MTDLFSLAAQLQAKAEGSDGRDTAVLVYSIQNACSNLTKSQYEFRAADVTIHDLEPRPTDMTIQLVNAENKCKELATGLSVVDRIHDETVLVTNGHCEQYSPKVQNMIHSLIVLQIPAHQTFLAEMQASVHNEGINYAASRLATAFDNDLVDKSLTEVYDVVRMTLGIKEELTNPTLSAADGTPGEYTEKFLAEFFSQLHKGAAL